MKSLKTALCFYSPLLLLFMCDEQQAIRLMERSRRIQNVQHEWRRIRHLCARPCGTSHVCKVPGCTTAEIVFKETPFSSYTLRCVCVCSLAECCVSVCCVSKGLNVLGTARTRNWKNKMAKQKTNTNRHYSSQDPNDRKEIFSLSFSQQWRLYFALN